ncbi:potassium uptake protein TrkH family [Candidatus Nitrosoglobus terrae]|uniref:Trk system potassium uptake protein n=1 Tax=Candidatus Nitrosoglobus terrae TaxID=1630141 RepID=A0A1Q2SPS8_9GAMM|nr:TrkH family potassium uptake protein [Candidatus Nitrosoglobus terrae]BAW81144.1 potassium uptake protein TrkH family [Candidatus Nitrosoglobus terrae]
MQFSVIQQILGLLLILFSTAMLPPVMVSWFYHDGIEREFLGAFSLILGLGLLCWLLRRHHENRELRRRDGFVVAVMFWVVLSLSGSLPFFLTTELDLSFTDAVFESVSGLSTTGATVITSLDNLPKSILFYRQELEWLGGMGIVVLGVALLPLLGIGGMQLYQTEIPGPMKTNKLTPRIAETAKALWLIYLSLTVACTMAYWAAGMTLFDAVGHSFSTVAIGGFSTHDAGIGYLNSGLIEILAAFFMFLAGVNFSLHFFAWRRLSVQHYWRDEEFKVYLGILVTVAILASGYLWITRYLTEPLLALRHGIFYAISFGTTTGFTLSDYPQLPGFLPILLFMVTYIGACGGSVGGGMKVIRVLLLYKQGVREIKRLIHPGAIIPLKIGDKSVSDQIIEGASGFIVIYVTCFIVIYLLLLATGLDMMTSFSAVTGCLNNLGAGLGQVAANFEDINTLSKWVLCVAMLLGRLEIFPFLVLMLPSFWYD